MREVFVKHITNEELIAEYIKIVTNKKNALISIFTAEIQAPKDV